jgi:hypothetical protein
MKKIQKIGAIIFLVAAFYACKQSEEKAEAFASESVEKSNLDDSSAVSSSAAVEPQNSKRKLIRTANIKFKVKNVAKSTYVIEDATTKFGGFVAYTNLESNIVDAVQTKISQDSTLITTKYSVVNDITIRVPNNRLDTLIKIIAKQVEFLDARLIKQDDVTLQLLSNKMAQSRSENTEKRIEKAIDTKGKKLDQIIDAEANLESKKEQNGNKKLENLSLNDQVNFSTLSLKIYQNQAVKQEIVANEKSINAYRPNIGFQILDGLKTGWFMLEAIIAFVVQLWSIALIALMSWFGYKRFLKK